jgi:hypothetical protein
MSSIAFSSLDSEFSDLKDQSCVKNIVSNIGQFLLLLEEAHVDLKVITQSVVVELRIITDGDGDTSSSEELNLYNILLEKFVSNPFKH